MRLFILFIFTTLISLTIISGYSQGITGGRVEDKAKFLPIPYINYDRSLGFSMGALPMIMFNPVKKDTISPSSIVGALGIYTTNKTWFAMGFGAFYFDEDKWRVKTAGGYGSVFFQFYLDNPVDAWIPYNTDVAFAFVQVQRKIIKQLYGGVSYIFLKFDTELDGIPGSNSSTLHGLGLDLSFDKRDNVYYPRKGYITNVQYFSFPGWLGNDNSSEKIEFDFSHYFPTRENKDVLAARFFAGLGLGDLSFNQQFIVSDPDIRGYTQGEFRGNYLLSLQGEYRWDFYKRWGAVGFGGIATIFEAINENDNGKILPGLGTGFRYAIQKNTQLKVGMDVAAGLNDWGIYFRISEAF